jgi:hypothetical protein
MKPVDEEFYKNIGVVCDEWYVKTTSLLKKISDILRSWWRFGVEISTRPCRELEIIFDRPSRIKISRDKVYLYLHWFHEEDLDRLRIVIDVVKSLGMKLHVEVDGRRDHCLVEPNKMIEFGFSKDLSMYYHLVIE